MKQSNNLRYIFKINSSRLRRSNWSLKLEVWEAMSETEELVSISDSQVLRFFTGCAQDKSNFNEKISLLNNKIKQIKSKTSSINTRKKVRSLYADKYTALFTPDYVNIVMENKKDFSRIVADNGFYINGKKFKRLYGTSGGQKKSTIVFVSELVYDELVVRINNGRNMNNKFVPAKLEAYKSLVSSASAPVSNPNGVLVVQDCKTKFSSNVVVVDDTVSEYPRLTNEKNYQIENVDSDGYGLISPEISNRWARELLGNSAHLPTGYCVRNSFCKGMLFTFDFHKFAKSIAKNNIVKDAWGNDINIDDVELILTTSMLKLWDSYDSIDHYLDCCSKNGYSFSITKVIDEHLEDERHLNYQFIQSLNLSNDDIDELIAPTVSEIHKVLGQDPMLSLLFLKGVHFDKISFNTMESNFIKALMIDKRMINDPFVRSRIYGMIRKKINKAKIGVLKVDGNFSIISGDPFSLCQSIFGLSISGLLKNGEFYSKYWSDRKVSKVAAFRAPMTCHNNIRTLNFKNTSEMQYWYKYMPCCTIFNSWDTTAHSLNGADKDGDSILTTNNPVILRNIRELDAILCVQKNSEKKIPIEADFVRVNKDNFGDEIGAVTNRITTMFDVLVNFEDGSKEHEELLYRISSGQNYQQNAIDKAKGIVARSMPKEWYDFHSNLTKKDDSNDTRLKNEFNMRILADKKPYFFIYIYPHLMKKYNVYIKAARKNCERRFGIEIRDLIEKEHLSEEESLFLEYYHKKMPVSTSDSTMNRICKRIEQEFDGINLNFKELDFDCSLLKSNLGYSAILFKKISELFKSYRQRARDHSIISKTSNLNKDEVRVGYEILKESFKIKAFEICPNEEELCNIVVSLCYNSNKSKQFAWDICGEKIIANILKNNDYTIQYPELDFNGSVNFKNKSFSVVTKKLGSGDDYENHSE